MKDYPVQSSSYVGNPPDPNGWKIEMYTGPGPLGRATSTAEASKSGHSISAMASTPSIAMNMIKDMIRRRDE